MDRRAARATVAGRFALRQKSSLHGFIGVAAAPPWREYLLYLPRDYYVGGRLAVQVLTIAGLGHAWSGGDPAYPFFAAEHRDATELVCDFFAAH